MSAGSQLQAALAQAAADIAELTGIYDGPPARAAFPYMVVDCGTESDWSHKSGDGREVLVAITIWDEQPERLRLLADAAEAAANGVQDIAGWQLVSVRFMRRKIVRDVAGPWATAIDFRARLLAA